MRALFLVAVGLVCGVITAPTASAATPADAKPTFDARAGERASVGASTRASRERLADRLGPQASVVTDPVNGGVETILRTDGLLSAPTKGHARTIALRWVRSHLSELGLNEADVTALRLRNSSVANGVTHLEFAQTAQGLASYDTSLQINVTKKGQVSSVGGGAVHALNPNRTKPVLSAAQALGRAQSKAGAAKTSAAFEKSTPKLVVFASPDGDRLGWRLTVAGKSPVIYDIVIDATDGSLLSRISLTDFAINGNIYENHPGPGPGGVVAGVDLDPYLDPAPTRLRGDYAHAYADINDSNTANAGEEVAPNAGPDFSFPFTPQSNAGFQICPTNFGNVCTWSGVADSSRAVNRKQRTTQLFYFVNRFHDWLEDEVGFDAGDGNFEGIDRVIAQNDDGNGTDSDHLNNANMYTPADDGSPLMQMYFFNKEASGDACCPAVSSAEDASVVFHEYTHGLSNRLIGDGSGLVARQSGAMGEGWSDWYAMDYLVDRGFEPDTAVGGEIAVGEYVTNNTVRGIRSEALDCPVGLNIGACNPGPSSSAGAGGYTFGDMGHIGRAKGATGPDAFEVHDDGELWAQTLWDLRIELGGPVARQLITEGMRQLATDNPSLLDARNAILTADQTPEFAGANHDAIWNVFAARGMGYGARTTSAESTRGKESFAAPQVVEIASTSVDDPTPGPGETVELTVNLQNPGLSNLTSVSGTLEGITPGVGIDDSTQSFGSIASGSLSPAHFTVHIPSGFTGDVIDLQMDVTTSAGNLDNLPIAFRLNDGGHGTFRSSDIPKAIPDNSSAGVTSSISVSNSHKIDNLSVCVSALHTAVADLHAVLTSPEGTKVSLFESPGEGGGSPADNFTDLLLADRGTNNIQDIPYAPDSTLAATGLFRPNEALGKFSDENPAGIWTLKVWDVFEEDQGALTSWSLLFDEASCPAPIVIPPIDPPPAPKPSYANAIKSARLDKKGRFKFRFNAGPAGTTGRAGFKTASKIRSGKSKKILTIASRSFSVPASGIVDLQLKASKSTLKKLKKKKKVATKVTVSLGGTVFTSKLTLKR